MNQTRRNATEEETFGMGILRNGLKNGANTLIIVAKEKRENVLLSGVVQEAKGEDLLIKC